MQSEPKNLLSLRRLADRFKLAASWLKAEAVAGRIPSLRAGRRLLFNAEAVERALLDRATETTARSRNASRHAHRRGRKRFGDPTRRPA